VQVLNTPTAEGPEYLNLLLTNATGGAVLVAPINATLTILNTNTGIAFGAATYATTEPSGFTPGSVVLSVVRFNNTNVVTTVNYSTTNGTAMAGTNYVAASGTVTFNPGDSVQTITVSMLHDPRLTGDLTFTVGLSSPSGGAQLTAPSVATVIDHDAETGLSFTTNAVTVLKTDGFVILPVISSSPNAGPVSVGYSTGGGSAAPGVDYTPVSGTLLFTNGQFVSYIVVPIIANSLVQGNKTFNVTLSGAVTPGVLVPPSTETVTIIETNTPVGFSFYSPIATNGDWGSISLDNNSNVSGAPLAWFAWTPTNSGEVEFDTIGSVDDVLGITNLATYMGVFSGSNFDQVALNSGFYQ